MDRKRGGLGVNWGFAPPFRVQLDLAQATLTHDPQRVNLPLRPGVVACESIATSSEVGVE